VDELRHLADTRPGYATYPTSKPGSPSWWQRHGQQPPARPTPDRRPWTGPQPLMSFGPPMILAPVDEQDDEQDADELRAAIADLGLADRVVKVGPDVTTVHEPRRWWHRITRGMA
jgi:hypothetical protein